MVYVSFRFGALMRLASLADGVLSVGRLFEVKRVALRKGLWFKVLSGLERAVVDLTLRCVDRVRSARLVEVLATIVVKLKLAAEGAGCRAVRSVGYFLARRVSECAVRLGYAAAAAWAWDGGFARFLAVMHLNASGGQRSV